MVITIIVLLILAGVTIATLTGENGILNKATTATLETELSRNRRSSKKRKRHQLHGHMMKVQKHGQKMEQQNQIGIITMVYQIEEKTEN